MYFLRRIAVKRGLKMVRECHLIIKKFMLGYIGRKKAQIVMSDSVINQTLDYVNELKRKLEYEAILKIIIRMKLYSKKMIKKRQKAAEKKAKAAAAKKKPGKYGT